MAAQPTSSTATRRFPRRRRAHSSQAASPRIRRMPASSRAAQGQWAQRLKHGLYPRRITREAAVTLDLAKPDDKAPLVRTSHGRFSLGGTLPPAPQPALARKMDFGLSWGRVVWHAFGAFGWGAAVALALRRCKQEVPFVVGALLAGPVVLG